MASPRDDPGFSLIELMLALALVAVLAGIGVSTHRAYLLRAHRTEAVAALLGAAAEQEKFHLLRGHYAALLGSATDQEPPGIASPAETPSGRYRLAIEHADGADYLISARPIAGRGQQHDLECAEFWIDASGGRGARAADAGNTGARCW